MKSGVNVKAQLWDTAGQERYRSITSAHYRKAKGALLVYDVTRERTFENIGKWLDDLKNQADEDVRIMLVGNKIDKRNESAANCISTEKGQTFADFHGLTFRETSAFQKGDVESVFMGLLEMIEERSGRSSQRHSTTNRNDRITLAQHNITPQCGNKNDDCCSC
eukprot:TRINITY_DN1440_c0_g4_i7.p1 TRINITY_DN1440_c0_g4~~TRINITY_DN1440_c0_g4_i7.p1  ORF type:complete len:164 (-),score=21.38 TRINITY_DN1440_c0_g4_i7:139-630(-)